jgi:predicted esterase
MRQPLLAALVLATLSLAAPSVSAAPSSSAAPAAKPWCAPEVSELSDHVCYVDGGAPSDGRRTLVVYLHGALATKPGFAYMQQRAMALYAKRHSFTVIMPTGPSDGVGYVWPSAQKDLKAKESAVLAGIQQARIDIEQRVGHRFDETFVVGFSSGAYYGSSLALRGALDVDGYIVLAGGTSWVQPSDMSSKRAPIFVGVSAADSLSMNHSRALASTLRATSWPARGEERNAGHGVDGAFMDHGIAWLRAQAKAGSS